MKCCFCKKEGDWKCILRDTNITMKGEADVILCTDCMNHYANGDYDKIKIPETDSNGGTS